jgi:hypothetical protein
MADQAKQEEPDVVTTAKLWCEQFEGWVADTAPWYYLAEGCTNFLAAALWNGTPSTLGLDRVTLAEETIRIFRRLNDAQNEALTLTDGLSMYIVEHLPQEERDQMSEADVAAVRLEPLKTEEIRQQATMMVDDLEANVLPLLIEAPHRNEDVAQRFGRVVELVEMFQASRKHMKAIGHQMRGTLIRWEIAVEKGLDFNLIHVLEIDPSNPESVEEGVSKLAKTLTAQMTQHIEEVHGSE